MEEQKECLPKKEYTPHQLRSRPLRCITLPAICVLIFIAYWLIICPILYVSVLNDSLQTYHKDWPYWWPFAYWSVALLVFTVILMLIVCYWRCMKERARNKQSEVYKYKFDTLSSKNIDPNQLYHVSLIDKNKPTEIQQNIDINNCKKENIKNIENEKCDKEKPKLKLENNRPLSQISTVSLPRSPLTPREIFFLDLIEAANLSPASFIPETNTFLDNEKRNCLPDETKDNVHIRLRDNEPEFFIANVPNRKSLTSEVFMFIDGGKDARELKLKMCDPNQSDDVFED